MSYSNARLSLNLSQCLHYTLCAVYADVVDSTSSPETDVFWV